MAASKSFPARIRTSTRKPASSSSPRAVSRRSSRSTTTPPRGQYQLEPQLDHQPLRPQPRKAAPGEVRRYPPGADRRRHLRRGQALLPAPGLRSVAHRQGGLCGPEGRAAKSRAPPPSASSSRATSARAGEALDAQTGRDDHHPAPGAEALQGTDLRRLRQPDLSGPPRQLQHPRIWRGGRSLLRQRYPPAHPAGGRHCWPA